MRFGDKCGSERKQRGDLNETGEIKREVTSVLLQVDAPPSYTGGVAASNHSELLDLAVLWRSPFRLDMPAPAIGAGNGERYNSLRADVSEYLG